MYNRRQKSTSIQEYVLTQVLTKQAHLYASTLTEELAMDKRPVYEVYVIEYTKLYT